MKNLLSIISLLIGFHVSFAQGTWTELNALVGPQPASEVPHFRSDPTGFAINGMAYLSTGYHFETGNYFNDLFGYNPSTNRWVQQIPIPALGRRYSMGGELNGKGFIALGYNDINFLNDTWEYDPNTMMWTPKAVFPGPARQEGFSFVINNKFYTGGGIDNNLGINYYDLWEYDPLLDSWAIKSSMPLSLIGSKTFQIGNAGYVLGGFDSLSQWSSNCYKYDQLTDSWSTVISFPGVNVIGTMSDSLLGYAITDTSLYCYNPLDDTWTIKASVPGNVYGTVSAKFDSLLYLLSSNGEVLSYNPVADVWTKNYSALGSSERPRISGRSLVLSDTAYFDLIKYDINGDNWIVDSILDVDKWLYTINSIGYALRSGGYEKYDPINRTWTICQPSPLISADYSFATTQFGYILGLSTNSSWEFWQYDPLNDLWTNKSNFPGRNQGNGNSFGILDKGYIACGVDSTSFAIDDFWEYDESSDTWNQKPDVPGGPRMGGCATAWNNKGVVAFGITDAVGIDMCDINVYDATTSTWSTLNHPLGCRSGNVIGFSKENKLYVGQGEARFSMGVRDPFYDFWNYDDGTSGFPEITSFDNFDVYPNPTKGSITLGNFGKNIIEGKVEIIDMYGRIVFHSWIDSGSDKLTIKLIVSSGMYLVRVYSDGHSVHSKKIIVE